MRISNKPRWTLVPVVLVLAVVTGFAFWPRGARESEPAPRVGVEARDTAPASPRLSSAAQVSSPEVGDAATMPESDAPRPASAMTAVPAGASENESPADNAVALTTIQEAVVRYDASALPLIDPYLFHADPGVREAARDGMIQVGDAAAARYLRAAADKAKDPREAVALLDAADYLELPPAATVKKREGVSPSGSAGAPAPVPPRPR